MPSRFLSVARFFLIDLAGSVVWFPIWWYTKGLARVATACAATIHYRAESYGFRIWLRNFFVPMFGQHDFTGRLISLFMRTLVLIWRSIAFTVEALTYGLGVVIWVAAPAVFILLILVNLTSAGRFLAL